MQNQLLQLPRRCSKKSYASIVSSQTKKGPTRVYVPANSRMPPAKAEKYPVNSVARAPAPESSIPTASEGNIPESKDAQYGAEGIPFYVRNLPLNVTVAQLEVEFKGFGPIKKEGVQVRSNRQQGFCFGFVESKVELHEQSDTVGSGRGRFSPGRGAGYRNDNFRGRGNFSESNGAMVKMALLERVSFQGVAGVKEDEVLKVTIKEEGGADGEVA
ncbi:hypothetical protein HAX54_039666 [Datura stramonium]|uniref:RRM domain-containing protein n=1 Tax=Datura stramonium TaxID=4076 RepID=A0ABS8SJL6_DATST|nr:hypothetical protein [Datura stramonium]